MDPLALLSNLHGDGPATLQRLRRGGCDSLSALCSADLADLVPILGWGPERAERFVREADALARRLGSGLLEPEDPAEERPARAAAERRPSARPESAEDDPAAPAPAPARASLREEVLERWRALDADAPPTGDLLVPRPPSKAPARAGRVLAEAGLDGLDGVRLRALERAGVTTLEALARADDLDLHRKAGLPFTVVGHLGFLARRVLARLEEAAPSAGPKPAAGPRARRNGSRGAMDAGGPFA